MDNYTRTMIIPESAQSEYAQRFLQGTGKDKLTKEQQEIILSDVQNKCVIAGAGSGKTTVIKHLIINAVLNGQNPDEICALSFNRDIAEELSFELSKLSNQYLGKTISFNVSTVHKQARELSRKYSMNTSRLIADNHEAGSPQISMSEFIWLHVRPELPQFDDEELLKPFTYGKPFNEEYTQLYKNRLEQQVRQIISYVQQYEEDPVDLNEVVKNSNQALVLLALTRKYIEQKHKENYYDFDDILLDCRDTLLQLKSKDPIAFEQVKKRYAYLLVDEFQDINPLHYEIINLLKSDNGKLVVVGDPRQSIYGFNGCDDTYMSSFCKTYPNSREFTLSTCFRCPERIVSLANKFMAKREHEPLKPINENKDHNKIAQVTFSSDQVEREFWSKFIIDKLFLSNHYLPNDVLVLCRKNRQLQLLRRDLEKRIVEQEDQLTQAGYDLLKVHVVKEHKSLHKNDLRKDLLYLSSIHSVKGLGAKVVILIDTSDGTLPHKTSDPVVDALRRKMKYNRDTEEENLFYVAVTRVKGDLLFIGRHEITQYPGKISMREKSPYLETVSEFLDANNCTINDVDAFAEKYAPTKTYLAPSQKHKLDRMTEHGLDGDADAINTRRKLLELLKKNQERAK